MNEEPDGHKLAGSDLNQKRKDNYIHMNNQTKFPLRLDTRPIDKGEFQPWGYGYSRTVKKQELWRPATRYIIRDKRNPTRYRIVHLKPGAYFCSDHGRIYSTDAQRIINKCRLHRRRETHLLDEHGNSVHVRLYKLMLDNWVEPPEHLRSIIYSLADTVNHRDGNCWRDRLDNLQYTPVSVNTEHLAYVLHRAGRKKKTDKPKQKKRSDTKPLA